ncbi:DUF6386 family protein [Pseudomonas sp. MAFF 302046]|jgi:hypothetical protein|uniref:DUF6386 family protein n=1 Tax=Pseudomonas morbosilactucae TaxID=2938197 RepID=A0ABT0JHU1_9PSED|nr:DUF6386 family protein [Pseudomonas morbosilactucae]MCK9815493.1 DUF6386 family protein [Pseudomonas morbosilactucae]
MNPVYAHTRFATDTATLAIFDPACLAHRAADTADWWSIAEDEVLEINLGHVLFANLGSDGDYDVEVYQGLGRSGLAEGVAARLHVRSGCLYIGAGEQVPADGLGPETVYGGVLLFAQCGTVDVRVFRPTPERLVVEYAPSSEVAGNAFAATPRLPMP